MSSRATILHADVDAFYASVAQRDDPRLRGRPVIVGGGVVLACSYEAKALGVRSGMGGRKARRLCPDAVVVDTDWDAYTEASTAVQAVFREASPEVEAVSFEEAFLDVRGLEHIKGTPTDIAVRLRRDVREQVGLTVSVGVARTKLLAKVASGAAKPNGLLVIQPYEELHFLHPLPVERIWGIGPSTAAKLHARGVTTVGQLAQLGEPALMSMVGKAMGRHLHAIAHGLNPRPVRRRRGRRSFGAQSALGRATRSPEELDAALVRLVDRVTGRMRKKGRVGRTVILRLRFGDFARASRSHTLPRPTAETRAVLSTMRALLGEAMPTIERRGLTLVGVTITNLDGDGGAVQLELPLDGRHGRVDAVVDDVRERFGTDAVTRATLLGRRRD